MADDDLPPAVVIDTLRDELAQSNDQRVILAARLRHAEQIIAALQQVIADQSTGE